MTDGSAIEATVRAAVEAPYSRVLTREEDGGYSASVLELPGCFSGGDTAREAMDNLDEAIALWVEAEAEDGHDIPPPSRAIEYSGRLTLRLLPSIHERAALLAQQEGVSLNRYLAAAITYYVGLGSPQAATELAVGERRRTKRYRFLDPEGRIIRSGVTKRRRLSKVTPPRARQLAGERAVGVVRKRQFDQRSSAYRVR